MKHIVWNIFARALFHLRSKMHITASGGSHER
jgi:hypothetical protein